MLLLSNYTISFDSNIALSKVKTEGNNHLWLLSFSKPGAAHPGPCRSILQVLFLALALSFFPGRAVADLASVKPRPLGIFHTLSQVSFPYFLESYRFCFVFPPTPLSLISCKILFTSDKFYFVSLVSHRLALSELFGSWLCQPVQSPSWFGFILIG